jgi:hypothetical protein
LCVCDFDLFLFWTVLGFEYQALCLPGKCSTT